MLVATLAAHQQDGTLLSPPMSSFSVRPLILPPCLHSVNLSFFCCDSSSPPESPREMYISKWSAPLFLTYSIPSVLPPSPFIHHCPLAPPSVCLPFHSVPQIIPSPSPRSSIGCCLFKLRHNIPRLFMEANFLTQIPFSGSPCSHPTPPSSSSSSWTPKTSFTRPPFCSFLFCL